MLFVFAHSRITQIFLTVDIESYFDFAIVRKAI